MNRRVQMLHIAPLLGLIDLQTFVKLIFRSKYFDFIGLFVAANVINLSNPRGNAGLQWCGHEFCTKLSTKTVRCVGCYLSHNCLHSYPHGVTLLSIIQAAGWPIWPLIACSVLALAIVIERFMSLRDSKVAPPKLLDEVIGVTRTGIPSADVVEQLENNSALGEVLASGLRALNADPRSSTEDLRANMEARGRRVAQRLEKYLSALATIASAAPLMGLFGTVVGMIEIFGSQAPGGASGANPAQLAHGISIALYNTAFGLMVAIPSLIFWRYFRARVDAYLLTLELSAQQLVNHLRPLRKS